MTEHEQDKLEEQAVRDAESAQATQMAGEIEEIPAAEGAHVLESISSERAAEVAQILDPTTAGEILSRMEPERAAEVIEKMDAPEASMVLEAMKPDDRVDVIEHVQDETRDELLSEMQPEDAAEVRNLEQYRPDTAGGIMTTAVTALPEHLTVEEAIVELRRLSEEREQLFYVYIVDNRNHLVGVLSMRDLILSRPTRTMAQVMRPSVSSVPVTMDQEEVGQIMRKYKYLAMPVVDAKNKLVGIITVDDVVRIMDEEATEDIHKMFGAGVEERLTSPWHFSFRKRLWWLIVNLGTAFLAAWVISRFQKVIAALPILAAYQTIVSGMGGNAGAQAMAVSIRGIAMGEVDRKLIRKILQRELIVGLLTGFVIGLVTWMIVLYSQGTQDGLKVGLIVFLALMFNHTNACVTGVAIPFVMKRLGFDPAQSATIFATTFTDCGGFFATLGLATLLQHWIM